MKAFAIVATAASVLMAGSILSADPILISDIESDTIKDPIGGTPEAEGQWAGFGAPLADLGITTNPAEVFAGDQAIYTAADWAEGGWGFGIRRGTGSLDVSAGPIVSFKAMATNYGDTTTEFNFVTGATVWAVGPVTLTDEYEKYYVDLTTAVVSDGPAVALDLTNISEVGFTSFRNGQDTGVTVFFYDEIYYNEDPDAPEPADPPVLPLVTNMAPPDFTSGGFPPDPPTGAGVGEWTRFGAAYNGISIVENAAGATDGDHYLSVLAAFDAGQFLVGARHEPYESDWSAYDTISFDVRANAILTDTSVQVAIFEADGDIWIASTTNPFSAVDEYVTVSFAYSDFTLDTAGAGSDEVLTGEDVTIWGFNFFNNQQADTQNFRIDNVRLSSSITSVTDWTVLD
ncbi:MAG: hypothetical protein JJU11_09170 [Candidatus Sumerlaeia bacterium]|nr:hypothetical protein [Candidatus Sumerlaeia bacterium]